MARKEQALVPAGVGEFETGCHTAHGNEMALYVQTTRELHARREAIFKQVRAAKLKWAGGSEFNVLLRLDGPGRELFDAALTDYDWKVLRGKSRLDVSGTAHDGSGGIVNVKGDFIAWLYREYKDWTIDREVEERSRAA